MNEDPTVMALQDQLEAHRVLIEESLHIGYAHWAGLIDRLSRPDRKHGTFHDEQVWTFLLGCGYALAQNGVSQLGALLTEDAEAQAENPGEKIWFEVLPLPTRKKEGNTNIDLALGCIQQRDKTKSGIELSPATPSWVCLCEMKWHSDLSHDVSHDPHRNQLARVIENAICLGGDYGTADEVHITLVTPSLYQDSGVKSRFYQYKYEDYDKDWKDIFLDLDQCQLKTARSYPDEGELRRRLQNVKLHWVTYDNLFKALPKSSISDAINAFWDAYGIIPLVK